ncbi:MAG: prepilin-type N-terminal cleavage/methylation domain-containing protein [Candidatus Hydrogenedentes bacterium]|nr:prepilin-type N-terminal cleavage/methylation domain-containing protein [Candidatus Hydrogenedentota bacterium]
MRRVRSNSGFSLFEMLVVLGVLGVVSTIGIGAFFNLTSAWRLTTSRLELGDSAASAIKAIRLDLADMPSARLTGEALRGVDVLNEEVRYEDLVRLEDDQLIIPVVQRDLEGKTRRAGIRYAVDRSEGKHVLRRYPAGIPDAPGQEVAAGVLSFEVHYLDGGAWRKAWSEPRNPEAVRVSVVLQGQSRPDEQLSRSVIIPIPVK